MDLKKLSPKEQEKYTEIKETILSLAEAKRVIVQELKLVDKALTKAIELKWELERKTVPVKIIPLNKERKTKSKPKPKLSLVGFTKEDKELLLDEAKRRGYV